MAKTKAKAFRTLYFIDGPAASAEDQAEAAAIEGHVVFRNAMKVAADGALEDFDAVAGAVPDRYREAADAKALAGGGEPAPEPKVAVPGAGSPLTPRGAAKPPVPKPVPGGGWKPNA